jgi:hypothetical protein
LRFRRLPAEGWDGDPPPFPLPSVKDGSKELSRRERELWRQHWRTPQAAAWAEELWRCETLAEFCRFKAIVERDPVLSASLIQQLTRYRDQLGLTPAGMRDNGWTVAADELAERREVREEPKASSRSRLKRVK